jgi:uncharacterized protein
MLTVDIHALPDGVHELTLETTAQDLEVDPETFPDAIVVNLRLNVAGRRIVAQIDVRAVATLQCDRTLVDFQQPVAGNHTVLFAPPDQLPEGPSEGALPLPDEATSIDLTEPVRDTLVLSLPTRRIAPGAEDVELPTAFGAETDEAGRPIDPRWDALRRLRDSGAGDGR